MWLSCKISPGQFTDEFIVLVEGADNTEFSLFTEKDKLDFKGEPSIDTPVDGWIKVVPLGKRKNDILVGLPQPTFMNGNIVRVRADQTRDTR